MKRLRDYDESELIEEERPFKKPRMSTGRLPFNEWLASLTPEQREAWVLKETKRRENKRKRPARGRRGVAKRRRIGWGRRNFRQGGGSFAGTNIIYPNIVGRGPYHLKGGLSWGNEDSYFRGNIGGAISDTVQGLGPYVVKRNSLMSAIDLGQDPPMVHNTNRGEATVINHREYIGDLISGDFISGEGSPTSFTLVKYSLNPGNSSLFPFLSSIASNFQEYEIRGALFELKSLSSEYAANLSLGSVFMAADYNVYGQDPTSKQQVENMEYASSAKPSRSMIMPIECELQNNGLIHKNVAIDEEYAGGDRRLYDWANVYIGSQGVPSANTPIAEIWITYEIALFKPIINGNHDVIPATKWDGGYWQFTGVKDIHPCGNNIVASKHTEHLTLSYVGPPSDVYTQARLDWAPEQITENIYYLVTWHFSSDAAAVLDMDGPDFALSGNASFVFQWPNAGGFGGVVPMISGVTTGEYKRTVSWVIKRTPSVITGGTSTVSLRFDGCSVPIGIASGCITVTTFPGNVIE